jgi:hypothetical protein
MRRTPEEVCVEYAIAAAAVREYHGVMKNNFCQVVYDENGIGRPGFRGDGEDCLSQYWARIQTDNGTISAPEIEYDEMCDNCKKREQAYRDRGEARKRLGAAKRSVEAVGKRLNAEAA